MLINHEHRIVLFHFPRTGGTSLELLLDGSDKWDTENPTDKHWGWDEYVASGGDPSYKVIAIERDPIQAALSLHRFHAKVREDLPLNRFLDVVIEKDENGRPTGFINRFREDLNHVPWDQRYFHGEGAAKIIWFSWHEYRTYRKLLCGLWGKEVRDVHMNGTRILKSDKEAPRPEFDRFCRRVRDAIAACPKRKPLKTTE